MIPYEHAEGVSCTQAGCEPCNLKRLKANNAVRPVVAFDCKYVSFSDVTISVITFQKLVRAAERVAHTSKST